MIRKLVTVLILIPLALAIVLFAVGNRGPMALAFDPFASEPPMFTVSAPVFLVLLGALIVVIIGGVAAWSRQSKWRRRARRLAADLKAAQAENSALRRQLEAPATAAPQPPQTSIASIAYRHPNAA